MLTSSRSRSVLVVFSSQVVGHSGTGSARDRLTQRRGAGRAGIALQSLKGESLGPHAVSVLERERRQIQQGVHEVAPSFSRAAKRFDGALPVAGGEERDSEVVSDLRVV